MGTQQCEYTSCHWTEHLEMVKMLIFKWYMWLFAKSHPILCDPMDYSTPGFPVPHHLLEFAQIHVHWVSNAIQPSHLIPFSSCPQSFPESGSFPMSRLFASGGQSIGASAWVLPMNIQSWFPLVLTGLISLLSKELPRIFSSTTIWKHQFFDSQPSFIPALTSVHANCKVP